MEPVSRRSRSGIARRRHLAPSYWDPLTTLKARPHIAVVGAGMAGLSCATTLQQAGYRVSLFDKSRSAGGRMSTRRDGSWQWDHGAQYFTARHPAFRTELRRWQDAGVAAAWPVQVAVLQRTDEIDTPGNSAGLALRRHDARRLQRAHDVAR